MRRLSLAAVLLWASMQSASAQPPPLPPGALIFGCGTKEQVEKQALDRLSIDEPSLSAREADLSAARRALEQAAALRTDVLAGSSSEAPYVPASKLAAQATKASSPPLAELFRRAAEDQLSRFHFLAARNRLAWANGLSDNARAFAFYILGSQGCRVDAENTAWLKAELERAGWFTVSKFGEAADNAAWLIVQHADQDTHFQDEVLRVLEPLAARRETNAVNFAYLHDRVAVNNKRPQLYGTQGRCMPSGAWEPWEIAAVEKLDERRAALGLPSEAVYKTAFSCGRAKQ